MSTATVDLLDEALDPVFEILTPEAARRLVAWRASEKTQRRLDELGDKCNEGTLTEAERKEYDAYVRIIDIIAILQAKARIALMRDGS
jgi:hypothetical protein